MTRLTTVKLVIAVAGIIVWVYGVTVDNRAVQWAGLGLVAVAALLRFAGPGEAEKDGEDTPPPGS